MITFAEQTINWQKAKETSTELQSDTLKVSTQILSRQWTLKFIEAKERLIILQ